MAQTDHMAGHNSGSDTGAIARDELRQFIERIERLEEEKAALLADIREVYAEAKGRGFDNKTMRQVIKLRKMEEHDRLEQEALLDTYLHALGMAGTPLGDFADQQEAEAGAGDDADDDTKVTLTAGGKSATTTTGKIKRAAKALQEGK